ncbi:hypothetical protein Q3G72_029935 [Acer saccharum]|nr:hypothetical protein Q3G72_029935 [Acer saccharum]
MAEVDSGGANTPPRPPPLCKIYGHGGGFGGPSSTDSNQNYIYFKPNTSNSSSKRIKSGGPVICDHPDSKHGIGVGLVGPLWSANDERVSDQDVDLVVDGSQSPFEVKSLKYVLGLGDELNNFQN